MHLRQIDQVQDLEGALQVDQNNENKSGQGNGGIPPDPFWFTGVGKEKYQGNQQEIVKSFWTANGC